MTNSHRHSPDADAAPIDVSVVIVNYNVRDFLRQALESVQKAGARLRTEIIVVDNDSVDGSVEMVREQFPGVQIIANRENVGFGAANNQGIERARGRYVFILNPDTIVGEATLDHLVAFMDERPGAGAAGCRILNPDGTFARESRRAFPTPEVAFYRLTGLSRLFPRSPRFGRYNMSHVPRDQITEVDALSGSCMMVRRDALLGDRGAGLFDTDFFMYGEDLDLCYRIQQAGWKIYYTPDAEIIHYKGESTKKGELRYVRLFYGAMVLFTEKHLHSRYSRLFAFLLRVAIFGRAVGSVVTRFFRRAALPTADFALVYGVVALLGFIRSSAADLDTAPLFFATVPVAYALGCVVGVALFRGYRRIRWWSLRPVLAGVPFGFLLAASVSFFVPDIAFSRIVVAAALPASWSALSGLRLILRPRSAEERRAVLVGSGAEADRLNDLLEAHPRPPFRLAGFVPAEAGAEASARVPVMGEVHQLRDLVRLRGLHDVVFAVESLSNGRIFSLMQALHDLPVHFRMLGEGRSHLIGKAQVAHLDLEESISEAAPVRSFAAVRTFDLLGTLGLIVVSPLLASWALLTGHRGVFRVLSGLPRVITGRRSLVGVAPEHLDLVPKEWRLRPGICNITGLIRVKDSSAQVLSRAYGYYATHQSASLDLEVLARSLTAR